jgi:hypothetical protein
MTSGKGGHYRIYELAHVGNNIAAFLIDAVVQKLLKDYPDETSAALNKIRTEIS